MDYAHPIIQHVADFAARAWWRIDFTWRLKRSKLYETTLTQDLIYWVYENASVHRLPFELWESRDEHANGDDLELAIETPRGYYLFPCKCKMVYAGNHYPTISHTPDGGQPQLLSLMDFAAANRGMAIYLLYNCCSDQHYLARHWGNDLLAIPFWGCSVVPAAYLRDQHFHPVAGGSHGWTKPTFQELHPSIAVPFHEFILTVMNDNRFTTNGWNYYVAGTEMQCFFHEKLFDDSKWKNLTPLARLSGIPQVGTIPKIPTEAATEFRPGYRIVISSGSRRSGLWRNIG